MSCDEVETLLADIGVIIDPDEASEVHQRIADMTRPGEAREPGREGRREGGRKGAGVCTVFDHNAANAANAANDADADAADALPTHRFEHHPAPHPPDHFALLAAAAAAEDEGDEDDGTCEMCERETRRTWHHLVPKKVRYSCRTTDL